MDDASEGEKDAKVAETDSDRGGGDGIVGVVVRCSNGSFDWQDICIKANAVHFVVEQQNFVTTSPFPSSFYLFCFYFILFEKGIDSFLFASVTKRPS